MAGNSLKVCNTGQCNTLLYGSIPLYGNLKFLQELSKYTYTYVILHLE